MNKNPFKKTRLLFWTLLLIAAVTTILFETGILTRGAIEVSATTRYLSDVTGVLITLCLMYYIRQKARLVSVICTVADSLSITVYTDEGEVIL